MGLKSTLKLILLFCTLNLILNQEEGNTLSPGKTVTLENAGRSGVAIKVLDDIKEYISIAFTPENPEIINPIIYIGLTRNCPERLAMSVQNLDSIYLFIKKDQVKGGEFRVCVEQRDKKSSNKFKIEIKDDEVAKLPIGKQTNYLVKKENKEMTFDIYFPDENEDNPEEVTIWVKGRSINKNNVDLGYNYHEIDGGVIFYGTTSNNNEFTVSKAEIDDYITVGSVRINGGATVEEIKINGNELIAATDNQLCFPVKYTEQFSCVSGKIHTLTGRTYFADSNKKELKVQGTEASNEIRDGIIADYNIIQLLNLNVKSGFFCIEPLGDNSRETLVIVTLQSVSFDNSSLATPPVYPGEIRRYIMMKGQTAAFYGLTPTPNYKESNYNMKSLKGFPEMYYEHPNNFPLITSPRKDQPPKGEKIIPSNRISVYSFYKEPGEYDNMNSISNDQALMYVYCADGVRPQGQIDDLFCEFEVTFFTNLDTIKIVEESTFSQYLDKEEIDNYRIKIPTNFPFLSKIYLDLTIFTGDADIIIDNYNSGDANKYYLSNKVFYSVHYEKNKLEYLDFKVKANSKVFYMVNYQLMYKNEKEDKNSLESGINYITSKSTEDSSNLAKTIYLSNFKIEYGQPFMATFYSPNCKFSLGMKVSQRETRPIKVLDKYAYVVLTPEDANYYNKNGSYLFNYRIDEDDDSKYAKKFCMVYVAGIELNEKIKKESPDDPDSFNGRTISLSEGVPHIFNYANDLPVAYYTYYISDINNHLIINLNLLDKAYFDVKVKIKGETYDKYIVYRTQQIYIRNEKIKEMCKEELEVCAVEVSITMRESTRERKIEITMYQLDNLPMYLEKNKVKNDIVNGYWPKHYYFDIAKNEYSDITLDFKRGSGFIFADIQDRKLNKPMENPEWRGVYTFPQGKGNLGYRTYGKKLIITSQDTEKCDNGCYVLITVLTNFDIVKQEDYGKFPMRISLNPRVMSSNEEKDSPIVTISVNDFIIGDIFFASFNNRRYDYYQVTLPFDSDAVQIDWQADSPILLINVGTDRPTDKENHFRFPALGDFVYKITKNEIIQKGKLSQERGLRGVTLTIGIFADVSDSLESSPYAFKLFLPPILLKEEQVSAEVIHIRSDQKVQCSPFFIEKNTSLCIFAVIFDDMDIKSNLVVYPRITNGKISRKYGRMIDAELVETNNMVEVIRETFQTYEQTTYQIMGDFHYEVNINKAKSFLLLVAVENAEANTIVDVLTSTYQYENNMIINPNPSTAQIFAIGKNTVNLYFATTQDLMLNIASVSGVGGFTWAEKYGKNATVYLNGIGDRVSLTTRSILVDPTDFPVLEIQSLAELNVYESGFIFYITYYPRGHVDPLKPNRINEIHYRTATMPLSYYAPVDFVQSWTVNLNFYNIGAKDSGNTEKTFFTYENSLFDIWGTILDDQQVFLARFTPDHQPQPTDDKKIIGAFDLIYGTIFFSAENITNIMPPAPNKTPNIYVNVQVTSENKGLTFNRVGLEVDAHSIAKEFGGDVIPEGVYISGRNLYGIRMYKLKLNKDRPAFKLEYSANSNFIKFALTSNFSSEINDEFKNMQLRDESGRKVLNMTLDADYLAKNEYLYLLIYIDENRNTGEDDKLNYFVFKYVTAFTPAGFMPIKELTDSKVKYENKNNKEYTVRFAPIKYPEVSYFIKAIYTEDIVLGENINSITMSESKGMNLVANEYGNDNQQSELSYTFTAKKDVMYIKVIAMLSVLEEKLIYLYDPIDLSEDQQSQISNLQKSDHLQTIEVPTISKIKIAKVSGANKKQKYEVKFEDKNKVLDYVKVDVRTDSRVDSPNVCFSNQDQDCMSYRGQLSLGGGYSTTIYIKKEQFINKNFYLTVECHDAAQCSYNITISKENEAYFDSFGVYNYFVSENNTNMIFKFRNVFDESNFTLTAYATGGKNIGLRLDDCFDSSCKQYNFTDGAAITVNTNKLDYYILTVNADPGDYISVGLKLFVGKSALGFGLTPEKGQISGMLRKNVLEMECFALPTEEDTYYITGNIYDGFAFFGYANDQMEQNQSDWALATKGYFSLVYDYPKNKRAFMCIAFGGMMPEQEKYLAYSLQIQTKKTFNSAFYTPQYNSFIYSRVIPAGKTAFFNGILPKVESEYMVYNMFTTEGYPKMYIYICETYPNCEKLESLEDSTNIKHVTEINRHSSFFVQTELMGKTPIDSAQVLLVVKCNEAKGNEKYEYCEFLTSIYGEKDVVQLINNQPFGQYDTPNDTDQYLIDFSLETAENFKIHIDFLVVTGDVNFVVKNAESENEEMDVHKYYLANKIFYSIEIDRKKNKNANLRKIRIDTKARLDSYYIVEYKIVGSQVEQAINRIYTNINYLIPISPIRDLDDEQKKVIVLQSVKIIRPEITVASFYSLNCKFEIKKYVNENETEQIPSYGNFGEDFYIHSAQDQNIVTDQGYIAYIQDKNKYFFSDNDMCMLYVSGIELYPEDSGIRKEILISEGVPQKFIFFDNIKKVRYVYPHADPTKNLTYHLNMIIPGKLKVKIFFREKEYNMEKEYTQSGIFFIYSDWIQKYCLEEDEVCSVTIEIEKETNFNGHFPQIEFTMKQVKNTPYYVPRGVQRRDYITNDAYLFLYTDVGKGNSGYLTMDFNRGGGYVYARIVKIDQKESDKNPDWRNYAFLREKTDQGLYYDMYNKKIEFTAIDTKDCDNGCYMLISVTSSVLKQELGDYDFQTFNLIADFNPEVYKEKNVLQKRIEIYPEEYVIGSLFITDESDKNSIFEYYTMSIPYDADEIEIDWQTNIAQLYINVGDERPELTKSHFIYNNHGNSIIVIKKDEILQKYKEIHPDDSSDSISKIALTIGVHTQFYETFGFTQYAFKIHLQRPLLNIYRVSSDQKTLCSPDDIGGQKYRCLFIIIYQDTELFNDLIVYAKSQDSSAVINMYADYIQSEIYDSYDVDKLKISIPTAQNAKYSTEKEKTNFLFLEYGDFSSHAFISVITDSKKEIEFYSSFKTFEDLLSPNPSSAQIYSMDIFRKSLVINFMTRKSVSVNIRSLYGEGRFQFHNDPDNTFYLRGEEDNLNYIIPGSSDSDGRALTLLTVENLRYNNPNYKNPGYAFILEFFLRSRELEVDSVRMDETKEMVYKQADTPVFYYVDVLDPSRDVTGYFYLHDLVYDTIELEKRIIKNDEMEFKGAVVSKTDVYKIKNSMTEIPPLTIKGFYDPTLKAGVITIPKSNYLSNGQSTIFMALTKSDNSLDLKYKSFRGEIGFSTVNGNSVVTQKLYQFGKLENKDSKINYKLHTNSKISNYVRIQFSANSKFVNFAISEKPDQVKNGTFQDFTGKRERGVVFVTFKRPEKAEYLYLTVFASGDAGNNKLYNYVFKYINALSKDLFFEYKIVSNNPKVEVKSNQGKLNVTFYPIDFQQSAGTLDINILYTVKIIKKNALIPNEKSDHIAITQSEYEAAQQFKLTGLDKKTVEIDKIVNDFDYAQVVATITQGSIIEYVAYQAVKPNNILNEPDSNPKPGESGQNTPGEGTSGGSGEKTGLYVIIGVSCFLLVVVVALVIVIVMYNSKNKDLLTQVNKISFVQSGASPVNDDANLLLDNQNELD